MHPHYPIQKQKQNVKLKSNENSINLRGSTPHTIIIGQNSIDHQNDDPY